MKSCIQRTQLYHRLEATHKTYGETNISCIFVPLTSFSNSIWFRTPKIVACRRHKGFLQLFSKDPQQFLYVQRLNGKLVIGLRFLTRYRRFLGSGSDQLQIGRIRPEKGKPRPDRVSWTSGNLDSKFISGRFYFGYSEIWPRRIGFLE